MFINPTQSALVPYVVEQSPRGERSYDIYSRLLNPGGSVSAGLAIYDTMQYIKCDVSTICMGLAASMGSVLLTAGAPGKRIILPNAQVMIHQPMGGSGERTQQTDFQILATEMKKTRDRLEGIIAKHCGQPVDKVVASRFASDEKKAE